MYEVLILVTGCDNVRKDEELGDGRFSPLECEVLLIGWEARLAG